MKFIYKESEYDVPTSLSQIKLRQKIEFDNLYSEKIEALKNEVFGDENKEVSDLDSMLLTFSVAAMNFSFFSGIPLEEVEQNIAVDDVLNIYYSCFYQLFQQEEELELLPEYLWNDEFWKLESPELTFESKITFNEFITSKQIVKQMSELASGHWESLPYLACVYLKREDESFEEKWLAPGSERMKMMLDLPMDIAVAVAFFLQSSMSMYLKTLASSQEEEAEKDLT